MKKNFHKESDKRIKNLISQKITIEQLKKSYKQPKWCGYDGALDGKMGCWSLTDLELRKNISKPFCESCECFKSN